MDFRKEEFYKKIVVSKQLTDIEVQRCVRTIRELNSKQKYVECCNIFSYLSKNMYNMAAAHPYVKQIIADILHHERLEWTVFKAKTPKPDGNEWVCAPFPEDWEKLEIFPDQAKALAYIAYECTDRFDYYYFPVATNKQ